MGLSRALHLSPNPQTWDRKVPFQIRLNCWRLTKIPIEQEHTWEYKGWLWSDAMSNQLQMSEGRSSSNLIAIVVIIIIIIIIIIIMCNFL